MSSELGVVERFQQKIKEHLKIYKLNYELDKKSGYAHSGYKVLITELEYILGLWKELTETCDITPKLEEWEENVAETFQKISNEMSRQIKFHGIFRSDDYIIIDAKQHKFVVVERKQLEDRISTLSEAIHDELMKHDVKLRPYAKLVDDVVWTWFLKELLKKKEKQQQ